MNSSLTYAASTTDLQRDSCSLADVAAATVASPKRGVSSVEFLGLHVASVRHCVEEPREDTELFRIAPLEPRQCRLSARAPTGMRQFTGQPGL